MRLEDGETKVFTEESWTGLLPRLFRGSMSRSVRNAIDGGLPALKAEAERKGASAS